MTHLLTTAFTTYVLHPLHGNGYQWWSGAGSDFGIATGIYIYLRRHNCHKRRCWRLAWHHIDGGHDVESGHVFCRLHHPDHPKGNKRRA